MDSRTRAASITLYLKDTDMDLEDAEGKEQKLQFKKINLN